MVGGSNWDSLKVELRNFDWNNIKNYDCVEGAFNEFSAILKRIFYQSCPFKIMKIKKLDLSKPYITRNIKELIKEKHKMQRLYNKFPITYGKQYKHLRNRVNSQIRAAKANYFKTVLRNNTNNCKQTWKVINELLGRKRYANLPNEFIYNDIKFTDPVSIANQFNNYFVNAGIELSERFPPSDDYKLYLTDVISDYRKFFTFSQVSCLDVENIVRSFKDSSPGADEIPMKLFKENLPVLGSTVIFICNLSLMTGIFPSELATAIITCIFNSGNIDSFENYRFIQF